MSSSITSEAGLEAMCRDECSRRRRHPFPPRIEEGVRGQHGVVKLHIHVQRRSHQLRGVQQVA